MESKSFFLLLTCSEGEEATHLECLKMFVPGFLFDTNFLFMKQDEIYIYIYIYTYMISIQEGFG